MTIASKAAGIWIRVGALLLDGFIIGIPSSILTFLMTGGTERELIIIDVLSVLYSLLLPVYWNGYTVGKRICKIRIRKVQDRMPPTLVTMFLRNIVGGMVYVFTIGIGLIASIIMVSIRKDKRALHDLIAGTEVVYDQES
ncbi:RDD family protein [Paenibacillus dakarensis]|uniref:RDD family protein n=1 Tax=Paenibacillus dakarensis TaxID=1527293 RepID=UPI0035225168